MSRHQKCRAINWSTLPSPLRRLCENPTLLVHTFGCPMAGNAAQWPCCHLRREVQQHWSPLENNCPNRLISNRRLTTSISPPAQFLLFFPYWSVNDKVSWLFRSLSTSLSQILLCGQIFVWPDSRTSLSTRVLTHPLLLLIEGGPNAGPYVRHRSVKQRWQRSCLHHAWPWSVDGRESWVCMLSNN